MLPGTSGEAGEAVRGTARRLSVITYHAILYVTIGQTIVACSTRAIAAELEPSPYGFFTVAIAR